MNNTFDAQATRKRALRATTGSSLVTLARADTQSAPPAIGSPYRGELAIAQAFKPALTSTPYYLKETRAAMGATFALTATGLVLAAVFEPSLLLTGTIAFCFSGAVISGFQWIFKKHGPSTISETRLEQAKEALDASGDVHKKPLGLLEQLVLMAVMTIDGFLSGSALTGSAFGNIFTPRGAMFAAVGWGIGVTVVLFKLINDAALEYSINERRQIIRQLCASSDPADQAHALAMKRAVGGKLGNDYSTHANRYGARVALLVTVLVLCAMTFMIRSGSNSTADDAAVPATPMAPVHAAPTMLRVSASSAIKQE